MFILTTNVSAATTFKDVSKGNSHYEGITYLTSKGIINGYEDGTYKPNKKISRSQAAVLFTKALELPKTEKFIKVFYDVDKDHMYANQIISAWRAGIFKGSNSNFNDGSLTREQMATVLVNAFNLQDNGKSVNVYLSNVSTTHKENVRLLAQHGITNRLDDFRPSETVTRGQFATFMYKTMAIGESEKNSRTSPAEIGELLTVEKNDWLDGHQKYAIELTQTISGDEAWKIIKNANMFNSPPDAGMKYVLAKFRIKILELEIEPYKINHAKFNAVSKSGVKYDNWLVLSGLKPDLRTDLYEGAEHEGWTYFMVNDNDEPLAVLNQGWDDEVWFDISN